MYAPLLKTTRAVALSAASMSAFAATDVPDEPKDQVAASFERLLNHSPARAAIPTRPKTETDPLLAGVTAVLWEQPSYHLPIKSAALTVKPKQKR